MPQLHLGDAAIYYQECSHGMPLLLLHAGWGLAINGFAYQQDKLADEFRMIVPDRRGYGRSARVENLEADFHWQAADDLFALLDALNVEAIALAGSQTAGTRGSISDIEELKCQTPC